MGLIQGGCEDGGAGVEKLKEVVYCKIEGVVSRFCDPVHVEAQNALMTGSGDRDDNRKLEHIEMEIILDCLYRCQDVRFELNTSKDYC